MLRQACTKEQICTADPKLLHWEVDYSNKYSLNNWISHLDMHCASSFEIGLFGSLFFGGYLVSCAIFPSLADKYGRKIFTIMACVVQALSFSVMTWIPNLTAVYIANFVIGATIPLKSMIAFTHLMEWIPGK